MVSGALTVAARVVIGGVLLARDELLRVVKLAVRARADLIYQRGTQLKRRAQVRRERHARHWRVTRGAERGLAGRTDDGRLEVDEDGARDVLARARLGEEGVEGIVSAANRLVGRHLAVGLDAVLEAEELRIGGVGQV